MTKHTRKETASIAGKILQDKDSSVEEKTIAGSVLAQTSCEKETSDKVASAAGKMLRDPEASKADRSEAGSALAQHEKHSK